MYNKEYVKRSFYGKGKFLPYPQITEKFADILNSSFCNDNQVLNILYKMTLKETCQLPSNEELFSNSTKYPVEVQEVLAKLQRQFPLVRAFENSDDAFRFIRSRYQQFGDEIEGYLSVLTEEVDGAIEARKASQVESSSSEEQ